MLKAFNRSIYNDQVALFLLGLGVVVSMQMSWVPGFFHDGYLYASFGKNAAELGKWLVPYLGPGAYSRFEQHLPTLFIFEGLFFKLFGSSYSSARIFNSLFFIFTLCGVYSWVRRVSTDKRDAYYSLFFFIILPPLLKKVRFPNLDIPLMFTIFWSFYYYTLALKQNKQSYWLLTGLFFGLSMLIKGPLGLLVPLSIFANLVLRKKLDLLLRFNAWVGLLFGFLIFSIWPLSLYFTNNFDIFLDWFKFTFLITIKDGRGAPEPFYTYFLFLIKQAHLWLILTIVGLFKFRKNEDLVDAFSFFIAILLFLSIPKFKYSHYIISLYPFLAICSAWGLKALGGTFYRNFYRCFVGLAFSASLVLLVFPITNTSRRDTGVHFLKKVLEHTNSPIKAWVNVNGIYSGVALSALSSFEGGAPVLMLALDEILEEPLGFIENKLFFIANSDVKKLKLNYGQLKIVAIIKKYSITVLAPESMFEISRPLNL